MNTITTILIVNIEHYHTIHPSIYLSIYLSIYPSSFPGLIAPDVVIGMHSFDVVMLLTLILSRWVTCWVERGGAEHAVHGVAPAEQCFASSTPDLQSLHVDTATFMLFSPQHACWC